MYNPMITRLNVLLFPEISERHGSSDASRFNRNNQESEGPVRFSAYSRKAFASQIKADNVLSDLKGRHRYGRMTIYSANHLFPL